jgi:hypothetical protein
MLVLWGQFAQALGLIRAFDRMHFGQKTYRYGPQTKVLEFFVAILAGLPYLKDLSLAAHPIDQDQAVARAWGQPSWADASGVSRTLQSLTLTEVTQTTDSLTAISQPFIHRDVLLALCQMGHLAFDVDLTGRVVSATSVTYPGVAFGYMGDAVHLGYQAAYVTMESPTYGRLWLSVTQHPGATRSYSQLAALVAAAEERTGRHPLRRTALLAQRLVTLTTALETKKALVTKQQMRLQRKQTDLVSIEKQTEEQQALVTDLQDHPPRPRRRSGACSRLSRAQQRLALLGKRQGRTEAAIRQAQQGLDRHQHALTDCRSQCACLQERLTRLEQENAANPFPVPAVIRLDAGFGTGDNIGLLIEMGYEVYTKPCSGQVTLWLKQHLADAAIWTRVGANAELATWEPMPVGGCPYALDVALERFHTGDKEEYSTLLHYGDAPVRTDLCGWFHQYNRRQTIEAGIKEGKSVFQMRHLKVRAKPALILQEQFAIFAANFVRWAACWLTGAADGQSVLSTTNGRPGVKKLVQVSAHTSAWVHWQKDGCLVRFTDESVFAGRTLQTAPWVFQPALPI